MENKIENFLIEVALKIAREKKGCLFIIKAGKLKYSLQMKNDIKPFNILQNSRRLEPLALQSGACIINLDGKLINYSAMILNIKTFKEIPGTRHAAAYTASLTGNISILASDDDLKVRIFKDGKLAAQLDPFEREIEKSIPKVTKALDGEFIKSAGAGTIGYISVAALVPTIGIAFLPGVLLFGSVYYLTKHADELLGLK